MSWGLARISGVSMDPTLSEGSIVLLKKYANPSEQHFVSTELGDIVVFADPADTSVQFIKRIRRINSAATHFDASGDNPSSSIHIHVPKSAISAVVTRQLWPLRLW